MSDFGRAEELYDRELFAEAEAAFRDGLRQDPESPSAHAYLALCLYQRGELKLAEISARRSVGIDENFANAHYALGFVLYVQRRDKDALRAVRRSIELDDEFSLAHSLMAQLLIQRGCREDALASARQAQALDPDCALAVEAYVMALEGLGQVQLARTQLEEYLAAHPENSVFWERLGWLHLQSGERQRAADCFQRGGCQAGLLETKRRGFRLYRWMCALPAWLAPVSFVLAGLLCCGFPRFVPAVLIVAWCLLAVRPLGDCVLAQRGQRLPPVSLCAALVMSSTGVLFLFALFLWAVGWPAAPALAFYAVMTGLVGMGALSCEDPVCLRWAGLVATLMVCSIWAGWLDVILVPGSLLLTTLNVWSVRRL